MTKTTTTTNTDLPPAVRDALAEILEDLSTCDDALEASGLPARGTLFRARMRLRDIVEGARAERAA